MILVYDGSGSEEEMLRELMVPTGMEFKLLKKLSVRVLEEASPTTLIYFVDGEMPSEDEKLFLTEKREFLLILMYRSVPEVNERIKYSSELVPVDPDNIDETRDRLRKALSSHTVRKLRTINDTTIYLAKNGLYPGNTYFTNPDNTGLFTSMLISKHIDRDRSLVVSRFNLRMEMPEILNDRNFIWVTDSIGAQRNRPVNLTFIVDTIIKRINEGSTYLIFIDIFDLMIVYHSFYDVARSFELIKSAAMEKEVYLILVLGEESMDHIQFGQITRNCYEWSPRKINELER